MPTPADFGAKPVKCTIGKKHSHWVIPQEDANTCGAKALRMAFIEMGLDTPTADVMMSNVGIGKGGLKGRALEYAVPLYTSGYKLEEIKGGLDAFGAAVRAADDLSATPILAYCRATKNDQVQGGGHWVTVARRNPKWPCDTFCVLDSASGTVHSVAISKDGGGQFSFLDKGDRWKVVLLGGYKFVKA